MKTNRALINIDYTNDFVHMNGALTCGEPGQAIEKQLVKITKEFIDNGDFVVFAIDRHTKNDSFHPETNLYPPHNIEGTWGRELYGELKEVFQVNQYKENVNWMDKTRYSAFAGTDLEFQLKARGITECHIVGVATDIWCLHSAIDLFTKGFHIVVHEKAVASFDPQGHEWALRHFKSALGAAIV